MNLKLVFENTNDSIDLIDTNRELVNHYVDSVNKTNTNKFTIDNTTLLDNVKYLQECLVDVDSFFVTKLKNTSFSKFLNIDLYNQSILNNLHMVWVKLLIEYKYIPTLLSRTDSKLLKKFNDINVTIHYLETISFKIKNFDTYEMWFCDNIFGNNIIDFNQYNVSIKFNNLGRSTYNKWQIYDQNVLDSDTNDFSLLSGELILTTTRPYTHEAPKEYTKWCKANGTAIIGDTIGLGNFKQSVDQVQSILYRNIKLESNSITIKV